MKSSNTIGLFTLIFSLPAAAFIALDQTPAGMEKCYGIADAGQNDGPFMADYPEASQGAGGSKYPCERTAWRWVPKGKCTNIMIGFTPDGTALTGRLEPRAEGVDPVKCLPYTVFGNENEVHNNPNAQPQQPDNMQAGNNAPQQPAATDSTPAAA